MKNILLTLLMLSLSATAWSVTAPTPSSPSNNLKNAFSRQTFSWSCSESNVRYVLEIDTTLAFNSPLRKIISVGITSHTMYDLHYGTHYYWHVYAYNEYNADIKSPWSEVWY